MCACVRAWHGSGRVECILVKVFSLNVFPPKVTLGFINWQGCQLVHSWNNHNTTGNRSINNEADQTPTSRHAQWDQPFNGWWLLRSMEEAHVTAFWLWIKFKWCNLSDTNSYAISENMYWSAFNIKSEPIADKCLIPVETPTSSGPMWAALLVYTRQQIGRVTTTAVTLLNLYSSLWNPLYESAPGLCFGRGDDCWPLEEWRLLLGEVWAMNQGSSLEGQGEQRRWKKQHLP